MPNPVARPVRNAPEVANLDALVREALRGGDVGKLQRALEEAKTAETTRPSPASPQARAPTSQQPAPPSRQPAPQPADPRLVAPNPLAGLGAAMGNAQAAWSSGDLAATAAALATLRALVERAQAEITVRGQDPRPPDVDPLLDTLPEITAVMALDEATDPGGVVPEEAEPVPLPPIRLSHALLIDGLGDTDLAGPLAAALQVDVATARVLAVTRHTQAALRGDDPATLEARASRVRSALSIGACVVARAEILTITAATPILAIEERSARLGMGTPWLDDTDLLASDRLPADGPLVALDDVRLLVIGEVEQRTWREGSDGGRWLRQRYGVDTATFERRRVVIDLHTPKRILRIVEGMTDLRRLSGGDGGVSRRALKSLIENAARRWPGVLSEPKRACPAGHTSLGAGGTRQTSGWPLWEEHTRFCRLHRIGE